MKRLIILFTVLLFFITSAKSYSQFVEEWSSPSYSDDVQAGWVSLYILNPYSGYQNYRFYVNDQDKIEYMHEGGYNLTPEYTYYFTQAEKDAFRQIYSTNYDFTGDGFPEFYVYSSYTTTYTYYGFKLFDLVNNVTLIEFNDPNFYYNYYGIMDIDSDGMLELIVSRYTVPGTIYKQYISYNTGVSNVGLESSKTIPKEFLLEQNFPNPFNSQTNIKYLISEEANVELTIFDIGGSIVKRIVNEYQSAGEYSTHWEGKNEFGINVSSGTYFYELRMDGIQKAKKMVLLK
ncbi:MAG: T9SS type A sorting domain-containing protein [Ignavibacteria bacterium]|nr:T9SS type A sorting domain-containing protein [Ignavibacteria bacterium]